MSKPALLLTLTLLAAAWPRPSDAAVVYRSNEGWSVEGEDVKIEGSAGEQMRKAENFEAAGDTGRAYNCYRALVKNFGQSALSPKAQRKQLKSAIDLQKSQLNVQQPAQASG